MYQVQFKFKGEWRNFSKPVLDIVSADRLVDARSIINYDIRVWDIDKNRQVTFGEFQEAFKEIV